MYARECEAGEALAAFVCERMERAPEGKRCKRGRVCRRRSVRFVFFFLLCFRIWCNEKPQSGEELRYQPGGFVSALSGRQSQKTKVRKSAIWRFVISKSHKNIITKRMLLRRHSAESRVLSLITFTVQIPSNTSHEQPRLFVHWETTWRGGSVDSHQRAASLSTRSSSK